MHTHTCTHAYLREREWLSREGRASIREVFMAQECHMVDAEEERPHRKAGVL
jgi:hypothetical protein